MSDFSYQDLLRQDNCSAINDYQLPSLRNHTDNQLLSINTHSSRMHWCKVGNQHGHFHFFSIFDYNSFRADCNPANRKSPPSTSTITAAFWQASNWLPQDFHLLQVTTVRWWPEMSGEHRWCWTLSFLSISWNIPFRRRSFRRQNVNSNAVGNEDAGAEKQRDYQHNTCCGWRLDDTILSSSSRLQTRVLSEKLWLTNHFPHTSCILKPIE